MLALFRPDIVEENILFKKHSTNFEIFLALTIYVYHITAALNTRNTVNYMRNA